MRTYIFLIVLVFSSTNLFSQNWQFNFETAQLEAHKAHKPIILVFSGSDWCAPCIKLDKQIFQTDVFKAYTEDNVVLVKADFPRKKENALSEEQQNQNKALAEKYNQNGYFPYVLILNEDGAILGEMGYEKIDPEAYVTKIKGFIK
jgi:thioredoxin-related protein